MISTLEDRFFRSTCPACGDSSFRSAFSDCNRREGLPLEGTFVRCQGCRSIYLREIPAPAALEAAYASAFIDPVTEPEATDGHPANLGVTRGLLRRVSRRVRGRPHSWPEEEGRSRRILDFGCGSGVKLREFQARGWSIAGIDLNRPAIQNARSLFPDGQWFAGSLEDAPDWGLFDVIRTDNVLEHIPDPRQILSLLRHRLKPGGRLLAYVPNGRSLSVRLLAARSQASWMPFHLQLLSARGLMLMLRYAGFPEVRITQYTPLSWWSMSARQIVATPGFMRRKPTVIEKVAMTGAKILTPVWLLSAPLGLGEELIGDASTSRG